MATFSVPRCLVPNFTKPVKPKPQRLEAKLMAAEARAGGVAS